MFFFLVKSEKTPTEPEICPTSPTSYRRLVTKTTKAMSALGENQRVDKFDSSKTSGIPHSPRKAKTFSPVRTTSSHVVWSKSAEMPSIVNGTQSQPTATSSTIETTEAPLLMSYKQKILNEWKSKQQMDASSAQNRYPTYNQSSSSSLQSLDSTGARERQSFRQAGDASRSSSLQNSSTSAPLSANRNIPKQYSAPADVQSTAQRPKLMTQVAMDAGDSDNTPIYGEEHLDTNHILEMTYTNNTQPQLISEDSFNRPESPIFDPIPLPADSVIKRNQQRRHSESSTDSETFISISPRVSPRVARRQQRLAVCSDSSSLSLDQCTKYPGVKDDGTLHVPMAHGFM